MHVVSIYMDVLFVWHDFLFVLLGAIYYMVMKVFLTAFIRDSVEAKLTMFFG